MRKNSLKGNVLFIILITVALFAALSYAVSGSMRGGTGTITSEQARVAAGEILRAMQDIKQGYQYLWTQQGCSIDEISFIMTGKAVGAEDFDALSPKSDDSCDVFSPLGAGISYPQNLGQYQNETNAGTSFNHFVFWFSGFNPGGVYGVDSLGTASSNHIMWLQAVNNDVCINVNKLMNFDNSNDDIIDAGNIVGDAAGNIFRGKSSGCRARAAGGPYDIFYVIQEF